MGKNDPSPRTDGAALPAAIAAALNHPNTVPGGASERLSRHAHRASARQLAIIEMLQPNTADAPIRVAFNLETTDMNIYDTSAIATARSRIAAGIDAFDRTLGTKPVALEPGCDSAEALIDALSRAAIATVAADLAAFAGGTAKTDAEADAVADPHPRAISAPAIAHGGVTAPDPDALT